MEFAINRRTLLSFPVAGVPLTQFSTSAGKLPGDQSDLINGALEWCRNHRSSLLIPPGDYLVKKSINATADSGAATLNIVGHGAGITRIVHELDEDLPVIDMTGNGRAIIEGLSIRQGAQSRATTGVLIAKGARGGSSGNKVTVRDVLIQAGSTSQHAGIVIFNSDLSRIFNSEIYSGGTALVVGTGKPDVISSKYSVLSSQPDSTQFYINECELIGQAGPALEYTGGAALSVQNVYAALTEDGSDHIIRIKSPYPNSGNAVWAHGLRTENQSKRKGVSAFHFASRSFSSRILGNLNTDREGATFSSDPGINISRLQIDANASWTAQSLFRLQGGLTDTEIRCNHKNFGTISGGPVNGLTVVGALSRSAVLSAIPDARNLTISNGEDFYRSDRP